MLRSFLILVALASLFLKSFATPLNLVSRQFGSPTDPNVIKCQQAPACQAAVKTWNNTVVHPPPTVSYDSYPTYVGQTLCQDDRSPPALFYATNLYQCTLCIEQPSEDHSVSSQIRSFFNGVDPNGFPGWCGGNLVFTGTEKDLDTFTTSMYDFGIRMGFPLDLPFGTLATDNPAGLLWPTPIRANRPT